MNNKKKNKKYVNSKLENNTNKYKAKHNSNKYILEKVKEYKEDEDNIIFQTQNIIIREKPNYRKKRKSPKKIALLSAFTLIILLSLVSGVLVFKSKILNPKQNNINIKNETNQKQENPQKVENKNNNDKIKKDDNKTANTNDEQVKDKNKDNIESLNTNDLANKIPILTFHRISTENVKSTYLPNYEWTASIKVFEEQMKYLYDNNYKTISAEEFYCWYEKKCDFPKKTVMITFDDGDYEIYYLVLPVLKKYNLKAIDFLIGHNIKDKTDEFVEEKAQHFIGKDKIDYIKNNYPNLEFQSHTYNLHYTVNKVQAILLKNRDELIQDVKEQEQFNFNFLAYPYGVYSDTAISVLKNNSKIKMAFRFRMQDYAKRTDNIYTIPRLKINSYMSVEDMAKIINY